MMYHIRRSREYIIDCIDIDAPLYQESGGIRCMAHCSLNKRSLLQLRNKKHKTNKATLKKHTGIKYVPHIPY